MSTDGVWQVDLEGFPAPRRGKVRDVFDLGDRLLIVASDRLSAYDHVLRPAIPGKGKILSQLTNYWFSRLAGVVENHLVTASVDEFPPELRRHAELLRGRSVIARKAEVIPFECVARGFLAGSGYREYRAGGNVCGVPLPAGLERASRLPEPIFTPATKAESGHDENVSFAHVADALGGEVAGRLRELTLALYRAGAARAEEAGLLLADTKFEFGWIDGEITLIDEALTPDSSRYWEASAWRPGTEPVSFDKQFVRDWLDSAGWDRESAPPELPPDVVAGTRARYAEAFRRLTEAEPEDL
ncbi:MAG: phosphoribosylaminoimidazolesuccinocarboxamide synthase [Thermoanaerobaculia bacterium]|nr:MAG: phosphoribosylaminoimidazolesuccinocarboxamide synthase [Thermoanaerobaculia bacterium]MBZ0101922.1 phosphoribosylaminoimidazolesuccinocarboxamide synthase [Thermoanaerobaculia bacterium]